MFGTKKPKVRTWNVISSAWLLIASCSVQESVPVGAIEITGNTQGTTYRVVIVDSNSQITRQYLDSLLAGFDKSLSTYMEESLISQLNKSSDTVQVDDAYFEMCMNQSFFLHKSTEGAFDPTVQPLFEAWGFASKDPEPPTDDSIVQILAYVGLDRSIHWKNGTFYRKHPNTRFNFNAIAQGLSVDVLTDAIRSEGHKDFYVEIGGELRVEGFNREGRPWVIGIDAPRDHSSTHEVENTIDVSNRAIATSGNYRNFYEKDGKRYAHTLNPKTGKPVRHSLLSATVIADECSTADAYATAFMVMGAEKTLDFVARHPELRIEVYLLLDDGKGGVQREMSPGFKYYLS